MQHSDSSNCKYAHRDWRNRSFRGENLAGADFSGADLRGCDFSDANLSGANFSGAKLGSTPKQIVTIWAIAVGVAAMALEAAIDTGFGALGQTPGDPAWSYVMALLITWGISGAGMGICATISSRMGEIAQTISAVASGAFSGFFYLGVVTDKNPKAAIAGAVLGGILALVGSVGWRRRLTWKMAVAISGAVYGYGFGLLMGTQALDRGVAGLLVGGLIRGCVCGMSLFFAVKSLEFAVQIGRQAIGTSFRNTGMPRSPM